MKPRMVTSDHRSRRASAPRIRFCNEPRPDVSLLAVVWPAGDPAESEWPTVIDSWLREWDDALEGAVAAACLRAEFAWGLSTHVWIEPPDRVDFPTLLLVGATPRTEADWPGWTDIGAGLANLLTGRPYRSPGIVVDRIFAPGLGELAAGLFGALGAETTLDELVITGSIAWTDADREAVLGAWTATSGG